MFKNKNKNKGGSNKKTPRGPRWIMEARATKGATGWLISSDVYNQQGGERARSFTVEVIDEGQVPARHVITPSSSPISLPFTSKTRSVNFRVISFEDASGVVQAQAVQVQPITLEVATSDSTKGIVGFDMVVIPNQVEITDVGFRGVEWNLKIDVYCRQTGVVNHGVPAIVEIHDAGVIMDNVSIDRLGSSQKLPARRKKRTVTVSVKSVRIGGEDININEHQQVALEGLPNEKLRRRVAPDPGTTSSQAFWQGFRPKPKK